MLRLALKQTDRLQIGDAVVHILKSGQTIHVGIEAPRSVDVRRERGPRPVRRERGR